jgi:hypothetical protein
MYCVKAHRDSNMENILTKKLKKIAENADKDKKEWHSGGD